MKIFVCEFLSSGGLYRDNLPDALSKEACLMRDALLRDLAAIADLEVVQTYDPRTPPPISIKENRLKDAYPIAQGDDIWAVWQQCMQEADAVWLIAPETGGLLHKLTVMAEQAGKPIIGCHSSAVALTGNKYATYQQLSTHGILTPATYLAVDAQNIPDMPCYVAKPVDGVSCEDTLVTSDRAHLQSWLNADRALGFKSRLDTHIVQPYIEGDAISLSAVFWANEVALLTINQQNISLSNGALAYHGSTLNVMPHLLASALSLLRQVQVAVPGLLGYVGLDIIARGDTLTLLEINPRLTTSYAGMRAAIGVNPAEMILQMVRNGNADLYKKIQRKRIEIAL